jgi:hypothetical protein
MSAVHDTALPMLESDDQENVTTECDSGKLLRGSLSRYR